MRKQQRQKGVLLFGIVFSIIGTIAFVLGPREWIRVSRLKSHGVKVEGRVDSYVRSGSGSNVTFAPVFSYTAPNGESRTWQSDVYSNTRSYGTGAKVTLYVDPDNPSNVALEEMGYSLTRDFAIVVCMLFGLMGYSNLYYLLQQWWKKRRS